jgi:hypothetical protein
MPQETAHVLLLLLITFECSRLSHRWHFFCRKQELFLEKCDTPGRLYERGRETL